MNWWHLILTVIVSAISGGGVATLVVRRWLARDIENYRLKLKISEFLFQKEFEAASELAAYVESKILGVGALGMDWGDVVSIAGDSVAQHKKWLIGFMSKYRVVLPQDIVTCLDECYAYLHNAMEYGTQRDFLDYVEKFCNKLMSARDKIMSHIKKRAAT